MEVFLVQQNDDSLDNEEVVQQLLEKSNLNQEEKSKENVVVISGQQDNWRSLEDWAASICRGHSKLDRKLLMAQDDFVVVTKLLLQSSSKSVTGDSTYLLSDLLELQNKIKKHRRDDNEPDASDNSIIGQAARNYSGFLKKCGLIDKWNLMRTCLTCIQDHQEKPIFVIHCLDKNSFDLLEIISPVVTQVKIINGSLAIIDKTEVNNVNCDEVNKAETIPEVMVLISSYLRLLLCSKEELSLARAVTASGLLSDSDFSRVRKESENSSLPMYQTIVSFVRQMSLGGKSYAPGDDNSLHELLPSLSQFNIIMEKMQTKLEETSGAEAAVMAVINTLKSWLAKNGLVVTLELVDTIKDMIQEVIKRQTSWQSTPARGRMGRPAIKLLAGLVDLMGCLRLDVSKDDSGKTPARQSKLVASFKTPQAEHVLDPEDNVDCMVEEKSLGERLGDDSLSMVKTPVARPTFPRFKTCNDFTEGSPALLKSADRDAAITGGRTLMARGSGVADDGDGSPVSVESTRRILQEVQERQDQENKEQVEEVKRQVKKTKRCLSKEVDAIVREKMGMKRKNDSSEKEQKPTTKKKKFSTPKGQKKMTSFFTR